MLKQDVLKLTSLIPKGKVATYKQIADILETKAYQAIGQILSTNFDPKVPCHRIIKSDGNLSGYNR